MRKFDEAGWIVLRPEDALVGPKQTRVIGLVVLQPSTLEKRLVYYDHDYRTLMSVDTWEKP